MLSLLGYLLFWANVAKQWEQIQKPFREIVAYDDRSIALTQIML